MFQTELGSFYEKDELNEIISLSFESVNGFSKTDMVTKAEEPVSDSELIRLKQILSELKSGKPIQYILGYSWFYGMKFTVNPSVLIPRPETEELVRWIVDTAINQKTESLSILDIGTGSGCIAIALKKNMHLADVTGIDISESAISVATENAANNNAAVKFMAEDIFNQPSIGKNQFDVIVSNPPYVPDSDKPSLHERVLMHEPHLALFAHADDALIHYKAIADFALKSLREDGMLFFEIHERKGQEARELLLSKGFRNVDVRKDMSGKDRMIKATIN